MPETHGTKADGTAITDDMVEAMATEAERGYDVEEIRRRRRGGRPTMDSAASSVESVRLDPDLKRDLLLQAAAEHISVSEVIRRAIGQRGVSPCQLTAALCPVHSPIPPVRQRSGGGWVSRLVWRVSRPP